MNDRIQEQLLGYVLGALDDAEIAEVESWLAEDPNLQRELDRIEALVYQLGDPIDEDPPEDLVEDTCALLDAHLTSDLVMPESAQLPQSMREPLRSDGFRLGDFVVAAGVFIAAAMLFFPAISNSRQLARMTQCRDNLRRIGLALEVYCDTSTAGYFPSVPASGNRAFAGIYGPILLESGQLTDGKVLVCPSSPLATSQAGFRVPTLGEIDLAEATHLAVLQRTAGGSYGYNLGYIQGGRHHAPRRLGRSHFAIMSDAPTVTMTGYQSTNHGGRGQNILFEDGHIQFVASRSQNGKLDDPFRNDLGMVEAGIGMNDAVIAPSFVPPFIQSAK